MLDVAFSEDVWCLGKRCIYLTELPGNPCNQVIGSVGVSKDRVRKGGLHYVYHCRQWFITHPHQLRCIFSNVSILRNYQSYRLADVADLSVSEWLLGDILFDQRMRIGLNHPARLVFDAEVAQG